MKKYISIIAVILAAGLGGCKKDYLDLEVNPNAPSTSTPQLTLSGALVLTPSILANDYLIYGIWDGYISWNGGIVPPSSIFQYNFTNADFSPGIWNDWYVNATNYNNLIKSASADPTQSSFQAIAMIMKAYCFENLVDNFGNVPYTEAFQPSTILFPKYDDAAGIYLDLGKQLDAAIVLAGKGGTDNPGTSDVVFGGNMAEWIQFAETLKLRLAVRESNLGTNIFTGFPTTSSSYLTTDALVNPGYANTAGHQNPFYADFGFDPTGNAGTPAITYRANNYAVNYLYVSQDTARLEAIYSETLPLAGATRNYRGNVFGDNINIQGTKYTSGYGPGLIVSASQPSVLITLSESYFLQAEAAKLGILPGGNGTAIQDFFLGVEANFAYLGLTKKQADTYLALNNISGSTVLSEEQLITEKWVAFNNGYDNLEAYNDYRRTGYPLLPSSVDPAAISTYLPYRLYYPSTEEATNPDQYKAAGGTTINPFGESSKLFWAKK